MSEALDANQETPAARLIAKLEAFYARLPEDEKRLLSRIVQLAAKEVEVEGYAAQTPGHRRSSRSIRAIQSTISASI